MRTTLLLLIVLLFVSCSKEKDPTQGYFYHDFVPDTVFPMPSRDDVVNRFTLQIGPDNSDTMGIILRTASTYSGHMPATDRWIWLWMPDSTIQFIDPESSQFGMCSFPLDSGIIVSPSNPTMENFLLYEHMWNWPDWQIFCSSMEQGGYIGYRFSRNGHLYMGWMWVKVNSKISVTVDDYCYSLRPDAPLEVGMKE